MTIFSTLFHASLPDDLRAAYFDRTMHPQALTRLTGRAMRDGDAAAAYALADRRCRILPSAGARDYLLRAEAARRLGRHAAAADDVRQALEIDPTDVLVNLKALVSLDDDRREAAHRIITAATATPDQLRTAIAACVEHGEAIVAQLAVNGDRLTGFVTWPSQMTLLCRVDRSGKPDGFTLCADPGHPLATPDRHAASCSIDRGPGETMSVRFSGSGLGDDALDFSFPSRPPGRPFEARSETSGDQTYDLTVIVPVYEDFEGTCTCLDSLAAQELPDSRWRTIVVNDASPNARIVTNLDDRRRAGTITLITQTANQGFAASVNRAAGHATSGDILLLNSDTVLPPDTLSRLLAAARSASSIGTVTPLSNNAEILSFPLANAINPLPEPDELMRWDRAAAQLTDPLVEIPNGIGFCMLITRACWHAVGGIPPVYGRGYYEDVDFCLRAGELGFRNICAANLIVGHAGSRSFRASKRALVMRNLQTLETRYPTYLENAAAFVRARPLDGVFGRIEAGLPAAHDVLLVTTSMADDLSLKRRSRQLAVDGKRVLILSRSVQPGRIALRSETSGLPQSLTFATDGAEADKALTYLGALGLARIELLLSSRADDDFVSLVVQLGLPIDLHIHEGLDWSRRPMPPFGAPSETSPGDTSREETTPISRLTGFERIIASDSMARCFAAALMPERDITEHEVSLRGPALGGLERAKPRHAGVIAVLSPVPHADVSNLVSALLRRRTEQNGSLSVLVLGSTLNDLSLMAMGSSFVTGPLDPDEYAQTLSDFAADAVLLPYRNQYFHAYEAAQAAAARPGIFFDWSGGGYQAAVSDLALDPAICDDEAAQRILAWLASPIPSQ